jgi:hypothetical protein
MRVRFLAFVAAGVGLSCIASPARGGGGAAPAPADSTAPPWTGTASGYAYFVPDDPDYFSPILTADRGALHQEARYNYEGLHTGSLFFGWNLTTGEEITLEATPMLGVVFGDLDGVAPGYRFTLGYADFELYSEGEYLFATAGSSENFFYCWSELGYAPADGLRVGFAGQRTRAYQTELEFQRGMLAGFSYRAVDATVYLFNLGWTDPTVVVTVGVGFGG